MNIGIVIGVSEYHQATSLPGCLLDANSIKQLLELSNKFDEILFIADQTDSKNVKAKLTSFVKKFEDENIEEIFFYFSGHGLFDENEFYYVLTDYSEDRTRQTSVENSELDNLLRSLSANLVIKVVDACQAGTRYVKDPEPFRKYLQRTEKVFDKCYFFYSSQSNQSSYQSNFISDFTLGFLKAFIDRPKQEVRYKDIMDSLSDEFLVNPKQTPFFVVQGTYTETFGFISEDITNALNVIINRLRDKDIESEENTQMTLVQKVTADAKLYCDKEEAILSVTQLLEVISDFQFGDEILDLFQIDIQQEKTNSIPISTEAIGNTMKELDDGYMVELQFRTKVRETPKFNSKMLNPSYDFLSNSLDYTDHYLPQNIEWEKETYTVCTGAVSLIEFPYAYVLIHLKSKFPNIDDNGCIIIPFVSQTKIMVCFAYFSYKTIEWDVKDIDKDSIQWYRIDEYMKSSQDVTDKVETKLIDFTEFVLKPIKDKFDLDRIDSVENKLETGT